jgi:hypothetical protein
MKNANIILVEISERKKLIKRIGRKYYIIKMDLKEAGYKHVGWSHLVFAFFATEMVLSHTNVTSE